VVVPLIDFVERGREPVTLGGEFGEIGLDVAQAALRGIEARLGLGELARKLGGLAAGAGGTGMPACALPLAGTATPARPRPRAISR
jgi:hypothetical protein